MIFISEKDIWYLTLLVWTSAAEKNRGRLLTTLLVPYFLFVCIISEEKQIKLKYPKTQNMEINSSAPYPENRVSTTVNRHWTPQHLGDCPETSAPVWSCQCLLLCVHHPAIWDRRQWWPTNQKPCGIVCKDITADRKSKGRNGVGINLFLDVFNNTEGLSHINPHPLPSEPCHRSSYTADHHIFLNEWLFPH